ncbi:hypothetical protein FQA39_LY04948 [Lamprigera yunnana]|nr:hypothetical protein FQA39_LY04948 [Lamprigera yunnana]
MEVKQYILNGEPPHAPIEDGTTGNYLYKCLKKYRNIERCMTVGETGRSISYKDLLENTCRLAQSFLDQNYPINTIISVCSENSVYYMYPIIAAFYTGLTVELVNPNYTYRELMHMFNIVKPKIIFCSKNTLPNILQIKENVSFVESVIVMDVDEDTPNAECMRTFINRGCRITGEIEKNFKTVTFNRNEHVALILRSSGTTGLPKGVMVTDENVLVKLNHASNPTYGIAQHVKHGCSVLNVNALCHSGGCFATLSYITLGVHIVHMQKFNEELFLKLIETYKVQSTLLVPILARTAIRSPFFNKYNLSSLTEIACGGIPTSKETLLAIEKRLNLNEHFRQGYGLTEATLFTCFTPINYTKVGSVGKLLPYMLAKIIDRETNISLPANKVGEISFKGGLVTKGYFKNVEATKNAIDDDGWLHTGDIGYYDEEQYFYVVDRFTELIKYKGLQISPAELETIIVEHPNIKEAAVVGIPDLDCGELPAAFIVLQPGKIITDHEVHDFLKDKIMEEKKLRGGIIIVDTLPKTNIGKIMRKSLLAMYGQKIKIYSNLLQ